MMRVQAETIVSIALSMTQPKEKNVILYVKLYLFLKSHKHELPLNYR